MMDVLDWNNKQQKLREILRPGFIDGVLHSYRKKPVVVEAIRLTTRNIEFVEGWCKGQIRGYKLPENERVVQIQTLEGEVEAKIGDYVIKGIKGEFYPCRSGIFAQSYDLVE